MKNRTAHVRFALVLVLTTSLCLGQSAPPPKKDGKAEDAVLALKKVQSRAEIGADYRDYSTSVADAYFSVKMFVESDMAKSVPEFSTDLLKSITWYKTAGDVWKAMQSSSSAERAGFFFCNYDNGVSLCKSHPELVVWNTAKDGRRYSTIILEPLKKSLGYASEALEKADKYLNSQTHG